MLFLNTDNRKRQRTETAKEPTVIHIDSDLKEEEAVFLAVPVKIIGKNNPRIVFGDNAGFIIDHTSLEIENCRISRTEKPTEPRTVPIIYGSDGTVTLSSVNISVREGSEAVILRNSTFSCRDTKLASVQTAPALLIRADKSVLEVDRSVCTAQGKTAVLFSLTDSSCSLMHTNCTVMSEYAGRIAVLRHSTIQADALTCTNKAPADELSDAAFIADTQSKVELIAQPELHGFVHTVEKR